MRSLAVLLLLLPGALAAQEFRALISGQVMDPSGASIPGATVKATNLDTNVTVTATSTSDGRYVLAQVPAGPYSLLCEAAGFKKFTRTGISVAVGDRATIDIRLEVGALRRERHGNRRTGRHRHRPFRAQPVDGQQGRQRTAAQRPPGVHADPAFRGGDFHAAAIWRQRLQRDPRLGHQREPHHAWRGHQQQPVQPGWGIHQRRHRRVEVRAPGGRDRGIQGLHALYRTLPSDLPAAACST